MLLARHRAEEVSCLVLMYFTSSEVLVVLNLSQQMDWDVIFSPILDMAFVAIRL